ncbi:MAG: RING finger protein [Candidatus Heimdallarchaeota archaeon]
MGVILFLVLGSIFTSLIWIGDIVSWAIIGNGFTIDVILLIVAIGMTALMVYYSKKNKPPSKSFKKFADAELEFKLKDKSLDKETKTLIENEIDSRRRKKATLSLRKDNAAYFTCSTCGEVIKSKAKSCSACDSQRSLCAICQAALSPDDTIVRTPCCQSYAHKEHILNWLSAKGYCPNCLQKITESDLVSIIFIDYT